MTLDHPRVLLAARRLLSALLALNVLYGVSVLALLASSLLAPEFTFEALGVRPAPDRDRLVRGMRVVMLLGIGGAAVTRGILVRLRAIVDTVRDGDPFIGANAVRLQAIAWGVVGLELLHLAVGVVAANAASSVQPLDLDWSFSVTPWVAVLLLFVLARVFGEGARMRADLAGTV